MKYLPALAAVCLLIVPSVASAQQLPGDPNPHGTTVTVTDYNHNWLKPYSNSGTIQINSGAHLENKASIGAHATLTNESTGTINNDGKYSDDLVSGEAAVMENYGTFNNNSGGNLVSHGTFLNEGGSTLNNRGTLNSRYLRNNGTLTNYGTWTTPWNWITTTNYGTITNYGHLDNYNTGAHLTNYATLNNSASLTNGFNSQDDRDNKVYTGQTLTNETGGTLTNNDSGTIDNYAHILNNGWLVNNGLVSMWSDSWLTNNGTLINNGGAGMGRCFEGLVNSGKIYNYGTLTNNGCISTVTLDNKSGGTLTNNGHLFLPDTGFSTLTNNGILDNASGGTLKNYGTIDTTNGTFTNNGTLSGTGTIKGSYTDHGITKPGNSAGVMTIDGDYFKVEGSKEIELGGLFDGGGDNALAEFDRIDVTGNVELAGLLHVELIDGFKLHRGNVFEFLRVGGTLSGQYDGLGEGALVGNFGGQHLFITYGGMGDGGGVALYTNAVPEPTTVLIWSMLAGLGMTVRRRR